MTIERAKAKHPVTGKQLSLETLAQDVLFDNGKDLQSLYGDIEGDIFSPEVVQTNANSPIGVGDGIDVHNNVQDGVFKSAVLTGDTLVNLASVRSKVGNDTTPYNYDGKFYSYEKPIDKTSGISFGSVYGGFNVGDTVTVIVNNESSGDLKLYNKSYSVIFNFQKGVSKTTITLDSDRVIIGLLDNTVGLSVKFSIVILSGEKPICSHFTGMSSVKLPVLSTVGKQLLDENKHTFEMKAFPNVGSGYESGGLSNVRCRTVIPFNFESGGYVISLSDSNYQSNIGIVDGNILTELVADWTRPQFTLSKKSKIAITLRKKDNTSFTVDDIKNIKIQIEKGTVATQYEPHKTNNLTCLEPVELGSVGDVKDTLDVLTGEVVENTVEYTATGNENIVISSNLGNTTRFIVNIEPTLKADHVIMSNKFISKLDFSGDYEHVHANKNTIWLYVSNEKTGGTITGLKDWLKNNTTILRCQLATPIVKTVDLSGTPFGFAKGHVQLSNGFEGIMTYNDGFTFPYDVNISKVTAKTGEIIDITGITDNSTSLIIIPTCTNTTDYIVTCTPVQSLLPQIKYQVPTSRTGQITQNTNVIMKHDKKIYSLEMMLMSSSVEDAYQRYLLQNDVQIVRTMNISEGNENPLRYHMLSRLIDEGMYDEVDMLAKLDIFMMYGEISMDQYFELTDILLGFTEEFVEEV